MFDLNPIFNFNISWDFLRPNFKRKKPVSIKIIKQEVETFNHELNLEDCFYFIIDSELKLIGAENIPKFLKKNNKHFKDNISNFYKSLITLQGNRINKKMIVQINNENYLLVIDTLLQLPKTFASILFHIKYDDIELAES